MAKLKFRQVWGEGGRLVVSMVLERRLIYQLKVADCTRKYCSRIQAGVNTWLKNKVGLPKSFPR